MPPLDESFFAGPGELDARSIVTAEVSNKAESAEAALDALGCKDDHLIGCIFLHLSSDNMKVEHGEFALRGMIDAKQHKISCSKLWPAAERGTALLLTLPTADTFSFANGSLASSYVSGSRIQHKIIATSDDRVLTEDEKKAKNIGDFCIRAVAQLAKSDKTSGVKIQISILFYPHGKAAILDMADAAEEAGWPGISITEVECSMQPAASTQWGCPIIPLLVSGTPFNELPRAPTGAELRNSIAAIMGRSNKPDAHKTVIAFTTRINRILEHPLEFTDRPSAVSWPKPTPITELGKRIFLILFFY